MLIEVVGPGFQHFDSFLIDGDFLVSFPGEPYQHLVFEAIEPNIATLKLKPIDTPPASGILKFDKMPLDPIYIVILEYFLAVESKTAHNGAFFQFEDIGHIIEFVLHKLNAFGLALGNQLLQEVLEVDLDCLEVYHRVLFRAQPNCQLF